MAPPFKPVRAPLDGIPSLQRVDHTTPHSLVSLADVLRVHSIPLSVSLTKMLNSAGPNTGPRGTPLITRLHFDIEPSTATL